MTTSDDRYEPPANDSIIQGAGSAPTGQFMTNTTGATGCNDPWRYNNGTKTNESEIHSSSLDQVQQLINEDKDIVFEVLVAADYIDEIECMDGNSQ